MVKKISTEEIKTLNAFCHTHFVYQYDLQTELVDHLASSIEQQWELDPTLPFNQALKNCWEKFGIYGFSKVKEQKIKELNRKYNHILWKYFLDFYKWPKMVMTLTFTLVLFSILKFANQSVWVMSTYFILMIVAILIYYFWIYPRYFKIETQKGKSFLLLKRLKDIQVSGTIIVQLPISFFNINSGFNLELVRNPWVLFYISLITVSFTILMYGNLVFLPKKIKEHFMESYSEFAIN